MRFLLVPRNISKIHLKSLKKFRSKKKSCKRIFSLLKRKRNCSKTRVSEAASKLSLCVSNLSLEKKYQTCADSLAMCTFAVLFHSNFPLICIEIIIRARKITNCAKNRALWGSKPTEWTNSSSEKDKVVKFLQFLWVFGVKEKSVIRKGKRRKVFLRHENLVWKFKAWL